MGWRKSPQPLIDLFERAVPRAGGIERRRMFGYPAAFLAGHLFAGLHQESFILRLSEPDRERARAEHGVRPFEPMPGRRMREYVVLPESLLGRPRALGAWIVRSIGYVRSLPPKTRQGSPRGGATRGTRARTTRRRTR
jgi:TfoX/Sxy family transcriptional regulator of competence genes